VGNDRLHDFMFHAAVHTMAALARAGHDHRIIKINVYPNRRIHDVVSLRLFGTNHAKNKVFSRVLTPERLLDEEESWAEFEHHLTHHTVPLAKFDEALTTVTDQTPGALRQDLAVIRAGADRAPGTARGAVAKEEGVFNREWTRITANDGVRGA
jgi:hypothetical protein